jgi:hypothetical protein
LIDNAINAAMLPAAAAVIITMRWAVVAGWAIVTRAVHNRALNHVGWLVINRRWRRSVINRCGRCIYRRGRRINRGRGRIDRTGSHCRAHHTADDCANDCSSTPAWAAAMGFSLTCEGEGT